MTGRTGTDTGTSGTMGGPPDDEDELLEDERAPPPPELLRRDETDAVDDAIADARREPNPGALVAVANRVVSHSDI